MQTEIRREGGYWSLFVDGVRTIDRESFAIVDRVRVELEQPGTFPHSECAEVARSIHDWREGR